MAKIYRCSDRIPIKIDDITILISPLSFAEKLDVETGLAGSSIREASKGIALAIKYAVKGIEGVVDSDGNPYQVQFEPNGKHLTDASVDDLCNLAISDKLAIVCTTLRAGVPEEFSDQRGGKLEGVELVKKGTEAPSKNALT